MLLRLVSAYYLGPIRLILKLVFLIILIVAILGIILALTFDFNSFKGEIEEQASVFMKKELKINGDIKLGVENMRPSLVLHDIHIGDPKNGPEILAERFEVTIPAGKPEKGDRFTLASDIDNIRIDGRRIGDYELPLRFSADGFELPEVHGELDDAEMTGSLSYLSDKLAVDIAVRDLEYNHILDGIIGDNLDIDITLDAVGRNEADIRRTLAGDIKIIGGKGEMAGGAVNLWGGDLLTSILKGPDAETKINCTVADFAVKNGIARSRTIIIDTPRVTITGKGTIDLVNERVNITFTARPKKDTLLSLATPVVVSGSFNKLSAEPKPLAIAEKIGGLLLGAINPAAALLPMMEGGTGNKNPCLAYLK